MAIGRRRNSSTTGGRREIRWQPADVEIRPQLVDVEKFVGKSADVEIRPQLVGVVKIVGNPADVDNSPATGISILI